MQAIDTRTRPSITKIITVNIVTNTANPSTNITISARITISSHNNYGNNSNNNNSSNCNNNKANVIDMPLPLPRVCPRSGALPAKVTWAAT